MTFYTTLIAGSRLVALTILCSIVMRLTRSEGASSLDSDCCHAQERCTQKDGPSIGRAIYIVRIVTGKQPRGATRAASSTVVGKAQAPHRLVFQGVIGHVLARDLGCDT